MYLQPHRVWHPERRIIFMQSKIRHLKIEAYYVNEDTPRFNAVFTTGAGHEAVNEFNLASFAFGEGVDHLVVRPATKEELEKFHCEKETMDDYWSQLHWLNRLTEEGEELYLTLEEKATGKRSVVRSCYYIENGRCAFEGIDEEKYEVIRFQKLPDPVIPSPYSGEKNVYDNEWEALQNNPKVFTDEEIKNGAAALRLEYDDDGNIISREVGYREA